MRGRRWVGAGVGVLVALLAAVPAGANPRPAPGATWRAPTGTDIPATGDHLFLDGRAGDYLTAGRDHLFLGTEEAFSVEMWGSSDEAEMRITDADGRFRLHVVPPDGQSLTTGFYGGVRQWNDVGQSPTGELEMSGMGRGCNLDSGWYQIDELDMVDGAPAHVALRFGIRCERYMPMYFGQLRWSAPATHSVAPPASVTATATKDGIRADWTPSTAPGVSGYEVIVTLDGATHARRYVEGASTGTADFSVALGRRFQVVVRTRLEGGYGPRSRPSTSAVSGLRGEDPTAVALVEQLYRDVLGRAPDAAGRDYWLARLEAGGTRSAVTLALVRTAEQRRRAVERLFYELTARAATPAEVDALAPWLIAPNGYDAVRALIVGTEERVRDYDRSQLHWVDGLYRDVRNQSIGGAERDEVIFAIEDGVSPASLALPVIQDPLAHGVVIDDIYLRLLGRSADAGGRSYWQQQLVRGRSPEQVTAALLASPEYAHRATTF